MKNFRKSLTLVTLIILAFFTSCEIDNVLNKPVAGFIFSPANPTTHEEVQFTSKSKNANLFEWDFGDGTTSSYENPKHIYTQAGTFPVKLVVTGKDGSTNMIVRDIVVSELAPGSFVKHENDITANEIWSNKYIHIVTREIEVKEATLTIEPGTVVKFNDNAGLVFGYSSNISHSKLVAQGTLDKHIIFTANKTNPQQGSWRWIYFGSSASNESIMEYCDISYGGTYSNNSGSVEIRETNIIFNHNTVTHSAAYGIFCENDGYFSAFNNNIVTDNTGSSLIIRAKYAHTLGENNNLANTKNGIEIKYDLNLPGDFLWRNHGAKYTVVSDINVGSEGGTSLTIEKGVTIAFKENRDFSVGYDDNKSGKLTAIGTATEPIRFVSAKTNSSAGDWEFIWFGEFNDPTSKMEYCEIDAGGGYSSAYGAIHVRNTKISFDNCKITNSSSHGITLNNSSSFNSFTGNIINNSGGSSVKIPAQWAHTIGINNMLANDKFGIEVFGDFNHQNKSFTWLKQTCPYTLISDVEIGSTQGCTLTIAPGTTVKVTQNIDLSVGYSDNLSGNLIAQGTPEDKITFTSAAPTGAWEFIWFGQGTMQESILEHCIVNNGGDYSSSYGAIHCNDISFSNTPTIKNCHISNSKSHGISIYNASPILENNTFENNVGENVHGG